MKCLIVGAGLAGLTAARILTERGCAVTVIDKGRGVGGRLATRRIGARRLDHGAQFFTVRDPVFARAVGEWQARGWVSPWFTTDGHVRYRAAGGMNALAKELAAGLDVRVSEHVTGLAVQAGWSATTDAGHTYQADLVILTPPAPQTLALLEPLPQLDSVKAALRGLDFDPCLALLVTAEGRSLVPEPGYVRPAQGPVAWVGDNARKHLSAEGVALTLHATPEFSREYLERPEEAAAILRQEALRWFDGTLEEAQFHRWRYSQPTRPFPERFVFAKTPAPLLLAGDAFGGPRVEGAFLSGWAAAQAVSRLTGPPA